MINYGMAFLAVIVCFLGFAGVANGLGLVKIEDGFAGKVTAAAVTMASATVVLGAVSGAVYFVVYLPFH